ncbi:hypothetical protein B0T09DRAFT_352983 [Sordaria sp. MPI-SDFR-AT-0083]|nr:hypothetical protein B0T09DRAFT_352983 [Sordaria sp. MPI-SDFR-AT-0083]
MDQHISTLTTKVTQANITIRPHNGKRSRKMPIPDKEFIFAMRRLKSNDEYPTVWEEEGEEMHDSGCDISDKPQSLLTEGPRKQRKNSIAHKLGPTLPSGQIKTRERDACATTAAIINKHGEPEAKKTLRQNASTAIAPVHVMAIITKSNPTKPILNRKVNTYGQSDLKSRLLSEQIRFIDRKMGWTGPFTSHNRKTSLSWHWPSSALQIKAKTSLQDVLQNDQNKRAASSSPSTDSKKKETEYVPADDSDNKWFNLPGQIWNTTTIFLTNTVEKHLPFYASPKEKQWQEATRMWKEEDTNKRTTAPSVTRTEQERREAPLSHLSQHHTLAAQRVIHPEGSFGEGEKLRVEGKPTPCSWRNMPYAKALGWLYAPYTTPWR